MPKTGGYTTKMVKMTGEEFQDWQTRMGFNCGEAASALNIHPNTIVRYREKGGPYMLRLACLALYHRLANIASDPTSIEVALPSDQVTMSNDFQ